MAHHKNKSLSLWFCYFLSVCYFLPSSECFALSLSLCVRECVGLYHSFRRNTARERKREAEKSAHCWHSQCVFVCDLKTIRNMLDILFEHPIVHVVENLLFENLNRNLFESSARSSCPTAWCYEFVCALQLWIMYVYHDYYVDFISFLSFVFIFDLAIWFILLCLLFHFFVSYNINTFNNWKIDWSNWIGLNSIALNMIAHQSEIVYLV